jgi:hypothetical protein
MEDKRKHVKTGRKAPGGRRPGAGRPFGALDRVPRPTHGQIATITRHIPADATPAERQAAIYGLQRLVELASDDDNPTVAIKAAIRLRDEICGVLTQRHEVTGAGGGAITVEVVRLAEPATLSIEERAQRALAALSPPEPAPDVVEVEVEAG